MDPGSIYGIVSALPLPLAQALRRAVNAKSPHEQHNGAYYFFESTLKLAASAQIGAYLALGAPKPDLNALLENLARPSTGHWLALLRETSACLASRPDSALVPLSDLHARLTSKQAMPAARAFIDFAHKGDGRQSLRVLDLFDAIVSYRNQELGHGAMRERAFYAQAAPLLLDAIIEALRLLKPTGDLRLAVSRDVVDPRTQQSARRFDILLGDGLHVPFDAGAADTQIPSGRLVLVGGATRVALHPLLVYEIDKLDRDRVGFLNHVATTGRESTRVKRVEYLDYDSGDRLEGHDALGELAALFTKLRGTPISPVAVENLTRSGEAPPPALEVTREHIGDFEIIEELGRGGMGIVYKARQQSLRRIVALKVLPPTLAGDPVSVARFRREIAALGRCDHPNVVKVLTAGQDGDRHFYAMEYVEGADLARVCGVLSQWKSASGGSSSFREGHLLRAISGWKSAGGEKATDAALPAVPRAELEVPQIDEGRDYFTRMAEIMADAAEGVQHLHDHGIIHRDLKPANIMLTADGARAVVMDLGLAQLQDRSLSLTASSVKILGTLRYMPPEQLQHQMLEVTPRADIYSLGATLYELTALAPMFNGDTEARLIQQVLQEEPRAPRAQNPDVPRDLETVVSVATAKSPAERYPTAGLLAADLRAFARGEPIAARAPSAFHYLRLFYRKNRRLVQALGAAAALLVALTAWFVVSLDASRQVALEQRDIADGQRAEAERQRKDAERQRGIAEQERAKADNAAHEAREKRELAEKETVRANENATRADSMLERANENAEVANRNAEIANANAQAAQKAQREVFERLAQGLVAEGNSLLLAKRSPEARARFESAQHLFSELGKDDVEAQAGLTACLTIDPPPLVVFGQRNIGRIYAMRAHPDGKRLLIACGDGLAVWDVGTWKLQDTLIGHEGPVSALDVSPDGKRLVTGGEDGLVIVWDLTPQRPKPLVKCWGHISRILDVAWRSDGMQLASIDHEANLRLWDPGNGECLRELDRHSEPLGDLAYCAHGKRIATCAQDGKLWIGDSDSGETLFEEALANDRITKLLSLPGGGLLAGTSEGAVQARSADGKLERALWKFDFPVDAMAVSADSATVYCAAMHGRWIAVALRDGSPRRQAIWEQSGNSALCEAGGMLCSGSAYGRLIKWSEENDLERELECHSGVIQSVALAPASGLLYASGYEHSITAWDTLTGRICARNFDFDSPPVCMAASADGKTLAVTLHAGRILLFDAADVSRRRELFSVADAAVTPALCFLKGDMQLAYASSTGIVEVIDVATGKVVATLSDGKRNWGWPRLALSQDGTRLACTSGTGLQVFDTQVWGPAVYSVQLGEQAKFLAVAPDGTRVFTLGPKGDLIEHNLATNKTRLLLKAAVNACGLGVSDDGRTLKVAMCPAHFTRFTTFDLATNAMLPHLDIGKRLSLVTLSPSLDVAYTAASDGSLEAYALGPELSATRFSASFQAGRKLLEVLPGGRMALALSEGGVQIWDVEDCTPLRFAVNPGAGIEWAGFEPEGQLVIAVARDGRVIIVSLEGKVRFNDEVFDALAGPGDRRLYAYSRVAKVLCVFESDGSLMTIPLAHFQPGGLQSDEAETLEIEHVLQMRWMPDGKDLVLLIEDRAVVVVNAATGDVRRGLMGGPARGGMVNVAVSPDGKWLATSHREGFIALWDAATGRFALTLGANTGIEVAGAEFSADGRYVVSVNEHGSMSVWSVVTGSEVQFQHNLRSPVNSALFADSPRRKLICTSRQGMLLTANIDGAKEMGALRQKAEQVFDQLARNPEDAAAHLAFADYYAARGQWGRALVLYGRAGKLDAGQKQRMARCLWRLGGETSDKQLLTRAAAVFRELAETDEVSKTHLRLCANACEAERDLLK